MELHPDGDYTHRRVLTVLVGLMVGLFASVSSAMIVATALPTIVKELGATTSDGVWIVVASLLTMTVSTPIWGRLVDHLDRKRVTQVAILLFILGSLGAGLAPSLGMSQWAACSWRARR